MAILHPNLTVSNSSLRKMKSYTQSKGTLGLTLIEVTLVIAVLLGLISVLFIGVSAYKRGSDRAKCLMNASMVQKAVRSYSNLFELNAGAPLVHSSTIVGPGGMFDADPLCPEYGAYVWETTVPALGSPYIDCSDPNNSGVYHYPQNTSGW